MLGRLRDSSGRTFTEVADDFGDKPAYTTLLMSGCALNANELAQAGNIRPSPAMTLQERWLAFKQKK